MTRAIRNIAIIAHVDHGKTTMVDCLLRSAGTFRANQQVAERVMDSNDLERERGITILSKNCAVEYEGTHINIIDTPGHADFGGEVERVLSMVDGVLLLVDAVEGPMPQTRFVTRKALAQGLKPIVVVNKIDRPGARPDWVVNQTFDLFDKLGATEDQLDFPVIYASALNGFAGHTTDVEELKQIGNMRAVFDDIIKYIPAPEYEEGAPLQAHVANIDSSDFLGRLGLVRIYNGTLEKGKTYGLSRVDGSIENFRVVELLRTQGLERTPVESAGPGDIVAVAGVNDIMIGETIVDPNDPKPLPLIHVDDPAISMTFGTNDTGMEVPDFIAHYTALIQAIQQSYPYTDIIVNTVPPVPADHSNYPHMDQTKIDDFNMALLSMCEQMGLKFLNSAEALKDANGYGREDYYQTGDIHLKPVGLKAMLSYLRTHAYQTDDRRPDTANIPTRAEYTPNPSSAVTAPSSSEAAGSSEEQGVLYQASYRVDKTGGTLSSGSDSGKTSLSYEVTNAAQSISVTAVPQDGYVFVKWSDGVTQKTRTDTNFKQNVDVTAVFAAASVHISSTGKAVLGDSYTFTAKLGGKHLTADSIRWYANGAEVPQAAGKTTVKVEIDPSMLNATFKVYAVASYNGCTVTSNVLNVTVSGVSSGSSSHSSGSSGSSGSTSGSSSSGSTSSSGASSGTTSGASSGATSTSGSSSHSSSSSESTASPAGSASASNGTASSSHSTSSSHADSGESSSASHSSSSSESSSASSGSSHAASESNASKEAANEQSASTDSAS